MIEDYKKSINKLVEDTTDLTLMRQIYTILNQASRRKRNIEEQANTKVSCQIRAQ